MPEILSLVIWVKGLLVLVWLQIYLTSCKWPSTIDRTMYLIKMSINNYLILVWNSILRMSIAVIINMGFKRFQFTLSHVFNYGYWCEPVNERAGASYEPYWHRRRWLSKLTCYWRVTLWWYQNLICVRVSHCKHLLSIKKKSKILQHWEGSIKGCILWKII